MQYSHFRVKFSSADASRCRKIFCQNILNKFDLWKSNCCFFHRNVILLIFGWRQGSSRWSLLCRIPSAYPSANSSKNVFIILASSVWFYKSWQAAARTDLIQSEENRWLAWCVLLGSATLFIYREQAGMNFVMEVLLSVVLYFITVVAK